MSRHASCHAQKLGAHQRLVGKTAQRYLLSMIWLTSEQYRRWRVASRQIQEPINAEMLCLQEVHLRIVHKVNVFDTPSQQDPCHCTPQGPCSCTGTPTSGQMQPTQPQCSTMFLYTSCSAHQTRCQHTAPHMTSQPRQQIYLLPAAAL